MDSSVKCLNTKAKAQPIIIKTDLRETGQKYFVAFSPNMMEVHERRCYVGPCDFEGLSPEGPG